jgi:DNA-directed RNA polymerase subunit RPC12/RpoP
MPGVQNVPMLESATAETAAACPKCGSDMVLAVVTPLPVASQLGKHTYLCAKCNQTTTYILPKDPEAESGNASPAGTEEPGSERRRDSRETLNAAGTIYQKDGSFLLPCTVRDISRSGGRLELFKETVLPQYFLLSLMPDGSSRRLCSKVWQIASVAGLRFVERQGS